MTPSLLIRPVLAIAAAAALSACGMAEADPNRFENMANAVAAIPLDGQAGAPRTAAPAPRTAAEAGLRPALQVQVMDPHALWDARDGGLRGLAAEQGQRLAAAAAPAVADAVVRDVSDRIDGAAARVGLRPARGPDPTAPSAGGKLVQIGAYSSEAAARAAWARLDLDGLTPVYEAVEVGGRRLVRLKVNAPATAAAAVCAAAGVDDPWCHRAA
jgi:hypothetical protein